MATKPKVKSEKITVTIEEGKGTLLLERKMSDGKTYGTMQTFVVTGGSLSTLNQAIYAARGELDMRSAKAPAVTKNTTPGNNASDDEDEANTPDDETEEEDPGDDDNDPDLGILAQDRLEHERESQELLRQALDDFDGDDSLPAHSWTKKQVVFAIPDTDKSDADGYQQTSLL